jgi:hypothetical protein
MNGGRLWPNGREDVIEPTPRDTEIFRKDSGFADGGHEVRIARPAGQDVHVDMPRYTGSGAFSNVHTDIQAVRPVGGLEELFGPLHQAHQLGGCGRIEDVQ